MAKTDTKTEAKREKITKRLIDDLLAGRTDRPIIADGETRGFVARRLNSGAVTYGYRYRDRTTGKQRWYSLGMHGSITPEQARDLAKQQAGQVAAAKDPAGERIAARVAAANQKNAEAKTVNVILDQFVQRHVRKNLRSAYEVERAFNVYVRPRIGDRSIYDLRRADMVAMLDAIEDENGPVMADRVLAHVRKAFNWQTTRDDKFAPPIVKGMARTKPAERARKRILSDDEIRDMWAALSHDSVSPIFARIVWTLLLTAQRRNEVGRMRADEIDGDMWTIPAERYKTGVANHVPLSAEARKWLDAKGSGFVFSTTAGKKPFNGYSKAKATLDKAIAQRRKASGLKPMPNWTLHDLRRTGRSLMSRAGVAGDVAELVLGHVIPGVRGVYDRHSYAAEKRDAVEKLAALVALILNPPAGNVIQLSAVTA